MHIEFLLDRFNEAKDSPAIIWQDTPYTYGWLAERVQDWITFIDQSGVGAGHVVSLEADFSPNSIALFLALIHRSVILVPLTRTLPESKRDLFYRIASVQASLRLDENEIVELIWHPYEPTHQFLKDLRDLAHAGLIVFTSGSTGLNKAAVHDFVPLLDKFIPTRSSLRTITFLLFDHLGGINTMLYILSNLGTIVTVSNRQPDNILRAVELHRVELLPTSPTFLNLMIISEAYKNHDLSSLKKLHMAQNPCPNLPFAACNRSSRR